MRFSIEITAEEMEILRRQAKDSKRSARSQASLYVTHGIAAMESQEVKALQEAERTSK